VTRPKPRKASNNPARVGAAVILAVLASAGAADAQTLTTGALKFAAKGKTLLSKNAKGEVRAAGDQTRVAIDFSAAVAEKGGKLVQDSVILGLRHKDQGTHAFQIQFGGVGEVSITCNGFAPKTGSVSIQCDAFSGAGTFAPKFAGAATYSATVTRGGKLVQSVSKQTGSFVVKALDTADSGEEEVVSVKMAFGAVRKGAWSIVVTHGDFTVTMTADGVQAAPTGALSVDVASTGLEELAIAAPAFTAVDPAVAFPAR
jgi:hypothetical protein